MRDFDLDLFLAEAAKGIALIYTLHDPRYPLAVRYVGKTEKSPKHRLKQHVGKTKRTDHKNNWIKKLLRDGVTPVMEIIDRVPVSEWKTAERFWIKSFRMMGCDLLNDTDGGEGGPNSESAKAKISAANKEWFKDPAHRAMCSKSRKGVKLPVEEIARREATRRANWLAGKYDLSHSEEAKVRIGLASKGRRWPASSKRKKKLAMKALWAKRRAEGFKFNWKPGSLENISKSHKGKTLTPEHISKISPLGRKMNRETKKLMSRSQLERYRREREDVTA